MCLSPIRPGRPQPVNKRWRLTASSVIGPRSRSAVRHAARVAAWFGAVSLIACAFFTAFTGASGVTIIALGGLLYPILIKERYGERFSLGLPAARR